VDRQKKIMIIDFSNYEDYPIGGYLSFARNMMDAFGSSLALVGISTSPDEPVGKWFRKIIDGNEYDFFALARYRKSKTKHCIPDRLATFFLVKFYNRRISRLEIENVFLQRQEMLMALRIGSRNICYSFAGLENPLEISKYWYGRLMAKPFEKYFFNKLRNASVILARGDNNAIEEMISRSGGTFPHEVFIKFPTRINTDIFRPVNKNVARTALGLSLSNVCVVTTGRLAEFKGWRFMVDCYKDFRKRVLDSKFYFIGEGEDSDQIKAYISECKLEQFIILLGKKSLPEVALYLNSADLFIMGSYKEGWSTSLMEALACGVPSCVTDFSSSGDMIINGENGFVVGGHDKIRFVECMHEALRIPRPVTNEHIAGYSTKYLQSDILKYWQLS